jgi:hypothetical protein
MLRETERVPAPPPRGWAVLAIIGMFSRMVILLLVLAATALASSAVPNWEQRANDGDLVGGLVALGVGGGALLALAAMVLAAACFLIWLHRAVRVARAYALVPPSSTPLGAVVCWFIPLVNLVKPYDVVQSLYRASIDPDRAPDGDWVRRWPRLFPIWWSSYLGAMILTNLFFRSWSDSNLAHPSIGLGIVAVMLGLVAAACATAIVWTIQVNQEALVAAAAREQAAQSRQFQPPAP